jgi:hypothetical protein
LVTRLVAVAPLDETCSEHCDEHHAPVRHRYDELREMLRALIEDYHRAHDPRFPWSLCSRDICRDAAIALGVRW